MRDSEPDERIIKSYVWHGDKCFFVSTINRDSSALYYPVRYAETIVWEFDYFKNERGALLFQDEDSKGQIAAHTRICERIRKNGTPEIETEEK